ncbi:MAG: cytochrome C biogenesis protein CycH [Bacteroidetes bacterium RIFOXYA12_FULL_35_11]|nr:MAG: cytochrome C biogenesis protein CycH [Bacteroidetes bacterium GWF2_35_48]OFY79531.1 MAG: cytochrome C biogenesis protein CycH [Bacteroidetes bacterium RIFOXYA12_FULL_35_11]OFY92725.1 MAG: cytochrome C biogenesis protein CycH [Bacteroidetes bacterium RIFOXYC12_FULL_35_7]HBX53433.1 cytochrome C biogenesis protein CycH [Bacteroidales bacterium]
MSEIKIYTTKDGQTEIDVKLDNETVWLNLMQLTELFQRDKSVISRHITNLYNENELNRNSTVAKFATVQKEGCREIKRDVEYYNLDVIISVGYRVKSQRGTQFRIWANTILKDYLIKGYSLDKKRLTKQTIQLKELQETVKILGTVLNYKELSNDESTGLLKIISDYAHALDILDRYDYQTLEITNTTNKSLYRLSYTEAVKLIKKAKNVFGNSKLFGHEKDDSFKSSIAVIYQTFDNVDLYPSVEEKAANLLYFITKNHSFTDGNKRIAAFIFLYFLEKNELLFDQFGKKRIPDNALVALTLMIAVSKSEEKDIMIKVIVNLINRNN